MSDDLKTATKDLDELRADLPKLEQLLAKHRQALAAAAGAAPEERVDLHAKVEAVRSMLEQHRADIATAEAQVARLQAASERAEREAVVRRTHAELGELHERYGEALTEAVTGILAALEPVRELRAQWIAKRARAVEDLEALGLPLATVRGHNDQRLPGILAAFERLGLEREVFMTVPDEQAPRAFLAYHAPARYRLPDELVPVARDAGLDRHPDFPMVRAADLLRVAEAAVASVVGAPSVEPVRVAATGGSRW